MCVCVCGSTTLAPAWTFLREVLQLLFISTQCPSKNQPSPSANPQPKRGNTSGLQKCRTFFVQECFKGVESKSLQGQGFRFLS